MSVQVKNKKVRVLSAKVTHTQSDKQRPFSGLASQTYTRKELIQNTYVGQLTQPPRVVSARSNQNRYVSAPIEEEKVQYRVTSRQNRQKEEMAEQISALKQTINRLVEQLAHQRGKVENMRRKNTKFEKILNMQFEDDKQWSSNKVSNHLVSGIKNMYQNMKEKYELRCKEYDNLVATIQATDILEYETYIKTLEATLKDLSSKLSAFQTQASAMIVPSRTQKHATQFVITQLNLQKQRLTSKLKQTQAKFKKSSQSNKDMSLKIEFLQKLIIEKDNNIHALQRKIKKSLAQQQKLKQENQLLTQQYSDLQKKYESERQELLKAIKENQTNSKAAFESLKSQKDYKIGILQTNNVYVQQMLTQIRKTNTQLNRELQQAKFVNSKQSKNEKADQKETYTKNNPTQKAQDDSNKLSKISYNAQGQRMPQKANKRYSEYAVKKRKIQLDEVQEIAELIRYRLIISRTPIEKLKRMFDFNRQKSIGGASVWQQQYITMHEVLSILKSNPINLGEQEAFLLARYLIEDVQQEYVYCDQMNENHREVVKSIVKTLIQQYPHFEGKQIDKKVHSILKDYGNNLKSTLKAIEPSGMIAKSKFYDVLKSLEIEVSSQVKQYLIAKMASNSKGMKNLIYKHLFDEI